MNNHELANKIMECGVGSPLSLDTVFFPDDNHWMGVDKFVRGWRVVGEMMEMAYEKEIDLSLHTGIAAHKGKNWVGLTSNDNDWTVSIEESLPRAINEAIAKALS